MDGNRIDLDMEGNWIGPGTLDSNWIDRECIEILKSEYQSKATQS